jgi:hypothetical protein
MLPSVALGTARTVRADALKQPGAITVVHEARKTTKLSLERGAQVEKFEKLLR